VSTARRHPRPTASHVKYLIVNGDDFGASSGINRGIVEAHERGILTSASLMVNMPCAEEAASRARVLPELSVGLHAAFTAEDGEPLMDLRDAAACCRELERQIQRFANLVGTLPTHLDCHHNKHRDARLLPIFRDVAQRYGLPLRDHSPVRYCSKFYGQWDGETHLEQISLKSLTEMLRTEIEKGFTELSCHPGYVDPNFVSSYSREREVELRTICDPSIRRVLEEQGIRLINHRSVPSLRGEAAPS
jgi:predicted glycoside hydrolase/deacetylase ChbG (UPF0249 family)